MILVKYDNILLYFIILYYKMFSYLGYFLKSPSEKFKYAITNNRSSIVKYLIDHNIKDIETIINNQDINGNTPLHIAVMNINLKIVDDLLYYLKPELKENNEGKKPLNLAKSILSVTDYEDDKRDYYDIIEIIQKLEKYEYHYTEHEKYQVWRIDKNFNDNIADTNGYITNHKFTPNEDSYPTNIRYGITIDSKSPFLKGGKKKRRSKKRSKKAKRGRSRRSSR